MENGDGMETCEPKTGRQTQQLCRFFSQRRRCNFGAKCRYLHVRVDSISDQKDEITTLCQPGHPSLHSVRHEEEGDVNVLTAKLKASSGAGRRACRYFLSGHCTMEDRCRFWHPPQFPSVGDHADSVEQTNLSQRRLPAPRPNVLQEVKLSELTEDVAAQLRDTEIKQMKRRFPKERLIIQERSDGKVTYYRATVEATDPDWPFDLKEIDIMVSFPDDYPREIFTLDIPLDQELPLVMGRHVQQASLEWLQAKHATNRLLGKVELLFRPFLRWLDRSLEKLFTEGARQLKKDLDLEKAGLQFISYQDLQATMCEKSNNHKLDTNSDATDEDEVAGDDVKNSESNIGGGGGPGSDEEPAEGEDATHLVENIKISEVRRGTEVRLLGLTLGENTATLVAQNITVCLQCNRCKVMADLTLSGKTACTAQCEKCSARISAAFRPSMLHHYSDVLGYLDLQNAVPSDLVLQDCHIIVGCLSCSQESSVQNLCYGQTKEVNCENCHGKLSLLAESARFQYIQPRRDKTGPSASTVNLKTVRDPAVQKGKPLPEKGACKHYKQSHRWLRFPCCGRAYPCDVCHDEDQDHPMELASRMICGFCAKEQPYSNGKPCVSCGSMMTRGAHTSHWEGGLGCRNRVKMSRYINPNPPTACLSSSDHLLQPVWNHLLAHHRPLISSPLFPVLLAFTSYIVFSVPFAAVDLLGEKVPLFYKYKIQPGRRPTLGMMLRSFWMALFNHIFFVLPSVVVGTFVLPPPAMPQEAPALGKVVVDGLALLLIFDAQYYIWHVIHHKHVPLYRCIHAIHHEYAAPFSWSTEQLSIPELMTVGLWSNQNPILLKCHPLTTWCITVLSIWMSVEDHIGYDLPWGLNRLVPFGLLGGAPAHDMHHQRPNRNYAPFFSHWDRFFRTAVQLKKKI